MSGPEAAEAAAASSCCPPDSWPQLLRSSDELNRDDAPTPRGTVVEILTTTMTTTTEEEDGARPPLPLYVVEPPSTLTTPRRGSVLVLPDIYSVRVLNPSVRSGDRIGWLCDALADAGYTVAVAGVFRNSPIDVAAPDKTAVDYNERRTAWFQAQDYPRLAPDVRAAVQYLQQKQPSNSKVAVIGFCFGVWLAAKASAVGDVDWACGVACHPSTLVESRFHGGDEAVLIREGFSRMPVRVLWAGNDSPLYIQQDESPTPRRAIESAGGSVREFASMKHGWISRGDTSDPDVQRAVREAIEDLMQFLDQHMPKAVAPAAQASS